MTTILGGTTVANPISPTTIKTIDNGEYTTAIDGTLLHDGTGTRKKWAMQWEKLTASEYNTLIAKLNDADEQTFVPPESSTSYNVMVRQDTKEVVAGITDGVQWYNVSADIEESS